MKKVFSIALQITIGIILIGKISNWFLNYSDFVNHMLNTAMFSLIGTAYIYVGINWDRTLFKLILITCGMYLIIMNLFSMTTIISIIGILCMLIPMLIARFSSVETNNIFEKI